MDTVIDLPDLSVALAVRVVGGKFNGYEGQIAKLCEKFASVRIEHETQIHELVIETRFLVPLHHWKNQKTAAELILRGHAPQT